MESQKRYTKKQRTLDIIERLKKEYPDTVCTSILHTHGSFLSVSAWRRSALMQG